jgi:glycosyltransferase involved in cell wall biosynthesis
MTRTILHVLATAQLEGISLARVVLAAARVAPPGSRVLAAFLDCDGPLVGRLTDAGVPAEIVHWGGLRNLAGNLRAWRYFRKLAPDVVHAHFGSEYLRAIMKAAGVKRVVAHFHDHGFEIERSASAPHATMFADVAVATSYSVAKMVRGGVVPQIIHPCIVPMRSEPPPQPESRPPVIGSVSRLAPVKGYRFLVQAMPVVLKRVPQARLEIAGDGPELPVLKSEVARLGLDRSVTFLGWQDDLDPPFARWRVFAAPSLMEGFGTSILEAAMRGLPIVASDVGGIPELVEHGVTGLLVPPARPDALAASIAGLLTDAGRAAALGAAAAERARTTFAPSQFDEAMRAVYARL